MFLFLDTGAPAAIFTAAIGVVGLFAGLFFVYTLRENSASLVETGFENGEKSLLPQDRLEPWRIWAVCR